MTSRIILGLLLALTSIAGMCSAPALLPQTNIMDRPKLGLNHDYLQLAAAEEHDSDEPAPAETIAYDPEFPYLQIPAEPDWKGLADDTKLFLIYQVMIVGVLYLMPESVSQWSDEDKGGNPTDKWQENVTSTRKDKDDWGINFIGHPYFGAVYYVRARHNGFDRQGSFWYAVIMSTIYEFGIEALFEPVSIQDLIFTPIGGAIVGEYFMTARENMKRNIAGRGYAKTSDKVFLFLTDPLGSINSAVNRAFGKDKDKENEARLELFPMLAIRNSDPTAIDIKGIQASYRW